MPTGGTLEAWISSAAPRGRSVQPTHPEGAPVELHPTADPGFTFMGFPGDCAPLGHTQMTGPRTCGATFSPTAIANAEPPAAPAGPRRGRGRGRSQLPPTNGARGLSASAGRLSRRQRGRGWTRGSSGSSRSWGSWRSWTPQGVREGRSVPDTAVDPETPIAPPATPMEFAKGKIQDVLKKYCDAYEALDPVAVQRVFPDVDMPALQIQLNKSRYKSVQCKFADPEFLAWIRQTGTAKVQADLTRVFDHTAVAEPTTR